MVPAIKTVFGRILRPDRALSSWIKRLQTASSSNNKLLAILISRHIFYRFGCCISPLAKIAPDVSFPHPIGIVIGEGAEVKSGCVIYQNVTLGRNAVDSTDYPTLEEDCIVYAGAVVVGGVTLRRGTTVAAHSVVLKSNSREGDVLIGSPAQSKYESL